MTSNNGHGRPPDVIRLLEQAREARDKVQAFAARGDRLRARRVELITRLPALRERYATELVARCTEGDPTPALRAALKDELGLAALEVELGDLETILRGHAHSVALLAAKAETLERRAKVAGLSWVSRKYFGSRGPIDHVRNILEEHVAPLIDEATQLYREAVFFLDMWPDPGQALGIIVPAKEAPPVSVGILLLQAGVPWSEPREPGEEASR